jgi:hypothetical protein
MKKLGKMGLVAGMILACGSISGQFPQFTYEEIGTTDEDMLCQSSLADVDKDNDLDIIIGSNAGTIWWFENVDGKTWTRHELGTNAMAFKGGVTADIDGDGWIDQISGGTWYKNPGNKTSEWTRFENGVIVPYDMQAADMNGDGKIEIIALSEIEGTFVYFPGDKPDKKWKKTAVGTGCAGGIAPQGIGDIDNDGDLDIVRSTVWFENTDGTATKWEEHKSLRFVHSTGSFAYSSRAFIADMDGDGDIDVVQSDANVESGSVAWQEKKDPRATSWYFHPIGTDTKQDLHSLCVADFDGDGDMDVFSGGGPMGEDLYKRCFIWENIDKIGTQWEKHEVLFKQECIDAVAADIDGDGDIDIIGKPWKGKNVYILRNNSH